MDNSGAGPPEFNTVLASCTPKEVEDFLVRGDGTLVAGFSNAQTTNNAGTLTFKSVSAP